MKNTILSLCTLCFAFANLQAQELSKPQIPSPEKVFYKNLESETISNPEKYEGNVKKVVRMFREYEEGVEITVQRISMFVNENNQLEKTVTQTYSYGIEASKEVVNHLEKPKTIAQKNGKQLIKIIKEEVSEDPELEFYSQGDEKYVYENELLVAYFNNNDSISYTYDAQHRLIQEKQFESTVSEFWEDDNSTTYYRSVFEDRALKRIAYKDKRVQSKTIYDKFGEVIDIYETIYAYGKENRIEGFQTVYNRYLSDDYDSSLAIDAQPYEEFPKVAATDSIQTGVFEYSKTNKITAYKLKAGLESEDYTIHYDKNDRLHQVTGKLQFIHEGNLRALEVEYEYLYDEKGNPKSIRSYYYIGGEKMLHKETLFEIEYYE